MKKYFAFALLLLFATKIHAQHKIMMGFPITDYILSPGDSITIVQVQLPEGLVIKEKTACLIKSVYKTEDDSVITVASGRCQLVKGNYFYFGLLQRNIKRKPVAGDMLYTDVMINNLYEGILFGVMKHSIVLNSVYDTVMADLNTSLKIKNAEDEKKYLALLCTDVKFTGAEMLKQGGIENAPVNSGRFKGQKILNAMQVITENDLKDFFRYISVRPAKYAGHSWKISEIMATWMVAGSPTPVE